MAYNLEFSDLAKEHISDLKRSDSASYKKVVKLLDELMEHPRIGTGKPELLKNDLSGYWSRKINKKDRLVYRINEDAVFVYVLRAKGHYDDK